MNRVEPFARLGRRSAVGKVAASSKAEAHDGVAGLQQRHHHRAVGLGAGMRWTFANSQPNSFFARSIAKVSTVSEGAQP